MSIRVNSTGICPHCKISNRFEFVTLPNDAPLNEFVLTTFHGSKNLRMCRCTSCGDVIVFLDQQMIYPIGATRPPCPSEVPESIASDYKEACLVEQYSTKAAAALARRCLQNIFHDQGFKKSNLNLEIDEAIGNLPSHLSEAIDAVRLIGNFAAHPIKSDSTGEIVEVEDGEAEWSLDVIEQLFDFYYVAPNKLKSMRQNLNDKLKEIGKPPLK